LQKPFSCDVMRATVAELLANKEPETILIVDDDPAIRRFVAEVLRPSGFRILEASGGKEAFKRLKAEAIDLMIIDLIMPDQDGLEIIQKVRRQYPLLPVIAISGGFGEDYLEGARLLGASVVMHKPFDANTLRETVSRMGQWRQGAKLAN